MNHVSISWLDSRKTSKVVALLVVLAWRRWRCWLVLTMKVAKCHCICINASACLIHVYAYVPDVCCFVFIFQFSVLILLCVRFSFLLFVVFACVMCVVFVLCFRSFSFCLFCFSRSTLKNSVLSEGDSPPNWRSSIRTCSVRGWASSSLRNQLWKTASCQKVTHPLTGEVL